MRSETAAPKGGHFNGGDTDNNTAAVRHTRCAGHRQTDPQTSIDAAQNHPGRALLRDRVRSLIVAAGIDGRTDDELQTLLPAEHPGSVSKRRHDLFKAGSVIDSGVRRRTRYGREAIVWSAA